MSIINELGMMMGRNIDATQLAINLKRRIDNGEYWEDVANEMAEKHQDISFEDIEKEFLDMEGMTPADYGVEQA